MAHLSAFTQQTSLRVQDTPLGYSPPVGGPTNFSVNYTYQEGMQPSNFAFSTLGVNWSINQVSYLTLDSSNNATVRTVGGGYEVYNYVNPNNVTNPYQPSLLSQAVLTYPSFATYQRQTTDGSIQVYNQPDGAGRIFMTAMLDPQGNAQTIQYDSNFRVTTVTDAIGQQSTFTYWSNVAGPGFYNIKQISDPFGRVCSFAYDSTFTNLLSITDVIGLVSSFVYDSQPSGPTTDTFITAMTYPSG